MTSYLDDEPSPDEGVMIRRWGVKIDNPDEIRPATIAEPTRTATATLDAPTPAPAEPEEAGDEVLVRGLAIEWSHWYDVRRDGDAYTEWWRGPECVDPTSRPVLQLSHKRDAPVIGDAVDVWPSPVGLRVVWKLRSYLAEDPMVRELLSRPCELSVGFHDVEKPVRRKMPNPEALDQVERTLVRVDHVAIVSPGTAAYRTAVTQPVPMF